MNKKRILASFAGFVSCLVLCVFFASSLEAKTSTKEDDITKRLNALDKLTKALDIVEQYYVDDQNISDLVDKSISGLLGNLDAHSSFLNEKEFNDMKIQTSGKFGGLGVTVGLKDGALSVIAPIEGTPADKAGIKTGDIILKIDDEATLDMSLDDAVDKMRGKPNTPIKLTIYRQSLQKPFEVRLIRDIIKVESVYAKMIEDENILFLRVTNFDENVVEKASKELRKYPNVKGVILDLRQNPGGLLNQAIGLSNLFLDNGVIVVQKGRVQSENQEYKAEPKNKISSAPLVVLVNGGSASASEIVSGALQDLKRAVIVGENTFGKGSVQQIIPISKTEALRLTIARYYLPSGRTIQAVGVKPDVEVFPGKVSMLENNFSIKESDLKKHLESELEKLSKTKVDKKDKDEKYFITQRQINDDVQLKSAIDTIKILNIKGKFK
ncbi:MULTISPECIES: S41 family peptidase [unclassified Campylobacter]|uniref:S41 family peptidase n=1 Tax=unclassified Campylobacter TaxID=2593542 RepID=UPI001237F67C|nr:MULTISPECIES: S41 family peptidase [unclassified Campylobacter]KAA6225525.1 S41 family peptidase [Campylobacter sp. LR196d]KAA6226962.1 S41 family peptidase [Campylobacter sp. LR185c]KAA6229796.1 S41 family peptidase [Campylobacter sp. LR286c]KAA6234321.1 S41 family peptidase [Campylobacter sp. LR291e]KAA8604069.1 peptidase S41 [Campylobacter sp. LR185c]